MAEETKTIKATVNVKLGTVEAARAAFSSDGTPVEVEFDVNETTAATIEEKEVQIKALQKEVDELKENATDGAAQAEALTAAKAEATKATADLAAATEAATEATKAHAKEIEELKAAHVKEIEDLKKPAAQRTVANNRTVTPGATPGEETNPNVLALRKALNGAGSLSPKAAK